MSNVEVKHGAQEFQNRQSCHLYQSQQRVLDRINALQSQVVSLSTPIHRNLDSSPRTPNYDAVAYVTEPHAVPSAEFSQGEENSPSEHTGRCMPCRWLQLLTSCVEMKAPCKRKND
eukprot:746229-Hanusia_phi.AAC.15